MLFDYDSENPEWASSEEYDYCNSLTEKKILRVLLTYLDFVNQRYTFKGIKYNTYNEESDGCIRNLDYRIQKGYRKLVDLIPADRDPAHFMAFLFESWKNREDYAVLMWKGLDEFAGIAYPSLKYIYSHAKELVKEWLSISNYKPTGFVPVDDMAKRQEEMIENLVNRWCLVHGATPVDYWTNPASLYLLDARYMRYSSSLKKYRKEIEAELECTIEELEEYFMWVREGTCDFRDKKYLETKAKNKKRREQGLEPEYANLVILEDE